MVGLVWDDLGTNPSPPAKDDNLATMTTVGHDGMGSENGFSLSTGVHDEVLDCAHLPYSIGPHTCHPSPSFQRRYSTNPLRSQALGIRWG